MSSSSPASQFGPNEWLVEEMYDQFLADPSSVDAAWHEFFADFTPTQDNRAKSDSAATGRAASPNGKSATDAGTSATKPSTTASRTGTTQQPGSTQQTATGRQAPAAPKGDGA
ncbi:2-oxoglutarate dehydrogenase E1 subunit family protein, partial [Saccharomonospora saliphila]|uniref:2-oxoglutarate dehydrogenase E1 subunit family protein n=1 Tax=Saccharomonospora saliphila TaxID=369829 RepID=UPI0018DDA031